MVVVVVEDVADALVEHGEEGAEGTQTREVHDVLEGLAKLKALGHQAVGHKERLQHRRTAALKLAQQGIQT